MNRFRRRYLSRRWIGKDNLAGKIRFWYYQKRGWVMPNGMWGKLKKNRGNR